jgi:glutamate-1-semialdehyde aminotransferase
VASNFRTYEPHPIFVRDGNGGHIHDLDGNQLCFGMESTQQPATPREP